MEAQDFYQEGNKLNKASLLQGKLKDIDNSPNINMKSRKMPSPKNISKPVINNFRKKTLLNKEKRTPSPPEGANE
jgi:hypothetical protein